mgnify:CR=1 FL=1
MGRSLRRNARIVVVDGRGLSFFRSRGKFLSPLFFLMTLKPFDQPIIDRNFATPRFRTIGRSGLTAGRLLALLLLSAPERFGDPIIARQVWSIRRSDRFGLSLARGALVL